MLPHLVHHRWRPANFFFLFKYVFKVINFTYYFFFVPLNLEIKEPVSTQNVYLINSYM